MKARVQSLRLWIAMVLALEVVAGAPAAAQAASDEPLGSGWATDGPVFATTVDGSGRIYLGGSFTHVYAPTIGGLELTASSDQADLTSPQVNDTIVAVASDGAGGWFIGGFFTAVGGVTRNHLAHILSDGSLDPSWNPNANGTVRAMAVSATDVYVGGDFSTLNGSTTRNRLAKIPTSGDGTVDASWDPNANGQVSAMAVSGTDVYVGGSFTTLNTPAVTRNRLARIPTAGAGTVDASWNPNVNGPVNALAVSATDVYIGGGFSTMNGATARSALAKIPLSSSTGTVDANWNPNANGTVHALAVSGTDVYVGGNFSTMNGGTAARLFLAKTPAAGDGTVDASWNPSANGIVNALAVAGTDVYAGGFFTTLNGSTTRNHLAKIPAAGDGTVDASWNPNPNNIVHALATSGSDVYAGGEFTRANVTTRNRLARLNADGSLDASWDPNANDSVVELALSGSDLYVGGIFTTLNGSTTRNRLAKIPTSGDGTVDASWDPNANGEVSALAVSGSDVYVGGVFTTLNTPAVTRNHLAKIPTSGSGTVDASWDPNANNYVNALAVSGSDVYVGGAFTTLNTPAVTRNRLAKIPTSGSGTVDSLWDPNASSSVNALAVSGTDVYVGGAFATLNGSTTRNRLAKIPSAGDGTVDSTWNPNANGFPGVSALAVLGTDVYVGGNFTAIGGQSRNRIARLSSSGTGAADPSWNPNADSVVGALAISGRLVAGGGFTTVGTRSNQGVALFTLLPTLSTAASAGVALGGSVHATATLAGGFSPTGTITFRLYGPDDASCSNTPAFTDIQSVTSGNGDYDSANFTPTQAGTYGWTASYSGDSNNNPASTNCNDPAGVVLVVDADLTIAKSHTGNFSQGETGATYTITVTNVGAGATSGTVTVTDTLPAGLTPTAPNGVVDGWTCGIAGQTVTCTRSDALAASGSYPAITLTVEVAASAPAEVTNTAGVSGGGESNMANNTASDPTTIIQLAGTLSLSSATYSVAESGGTLTVSVDRTEGSQGAVSVSYATSDGTAIAGSDYTAASGTLDWADGDSAAKTFNITITNDDVYEGDQTVNITLSSPTGGAALGTSEGVATITDDESAPTVSIDDVTNAEGNSGATSFTFTVTLSGQSDSEVTVDYATGDFTATAPSDYTTTSGILTFAALDTSESITVLINGDTDGEPDETFTVGLTPNGITASKQTGIGTIEDDDGPLNAPASFSATANGTSSVSLSWAAVAGATNYEIFRSTNINNGFPLLTTTSNPAYTDSAVSANTAYVYQVRAFNGSSTSEFSLPDAATTISFTDASPAGNTIKATHLTQLRTAVDALRIAAGLSAFSYTDPSLSAGTLLKRLHIIDLRTALDAARTAIGLTPLSYTDPTIVPGTTTAKDEHVTELRAGTQ